MHLGENRSMGEGRRVRRNFDWDVHYEKTIKNLKKYCNMMGRDSSSAKSKFWVNW